MGSKNDMSALPTDTAKEHIMKIVRRHLLKDYTLTVHKSTTEGENFFGILYKVQIVGTNANDNHEKLDLILKFAPNNPSFRDNVPMNRYFSREIHAYKSILPALDALQKALPVEDRFKFAKCHGASREEYREMVILDDLSARGYRLYDRLVSLDYDHVALAIKNLARYHAASFVMKKYRPDTFNELAGEVCKGLDYGTHFGKFVEQNKKQFLDTIKGTEYHHRYEAYLDNMESKLEKLVDPKITEKYNVICHGDCWTSNILFKYENKKVVDMIFLDWQVSRLASPVTDLAYLIFTSTDENLRIKHFHNLLDLYYETLDYNIKMMGCDINTCYPRNEYNNHLKNILPFGLLISIVLCPVLLCDRDKTPDLAAANEKYNDDAESDIIFSKTPRERLQGAARDCIKYDLL